MYIAFRWLFSFAVTMWIGLSFNDFYQNKNFPVTHQRLGYKNSTQQGHHLLYENNKSETEFKNNGQRDYNFLIFNLLFFAGACLVSIFHKKSEIILFTRKNIKKFYNDGIKKPFLNRKTLKHIYTTFIALVTYAYYLWKLFLKTFRTNIHIFLRQKCMIEGENHNAVLLMKLKELGQQRRSLGRLLINAIQENKNMRLKYQLESMAKNRLAQHVEDSQKEIKKNRSQYVSFQQLYLVTHQENIFLKSRIKKVTKEKEDAEKNLLALVNRVCLSKNKELKAYCSRIIVKTKNNLLNSDVKAEIQEFITNSRHSTSTYSVPQPNIPDMSDYVLNPCNSNYRKARIEEIFNDDLSMVSLIKDAPRLRGLPGECVWTVKDKNGIIEKLYEYEYEKDVDSYDIRRIREYSVYYDKDCLLDSVCTLSDNHSTNTETTGFKSNIPSGSHTNQNFLTGSAAFQRFLRNNKNILQIETPTPLLLGD